MNRILLLNSLIVLTFLTGCADLCDRQRAAKIDPVLHRLDVTRSIAGARVIDLASGHELYASNPDASMMPASNMKLPTSATFLDTFGPNKTFKTYLALDGDDLWIIGTGDPAIGDSAIAKRYNKTTTTVLHDWAAALKSRNIHRINGNLYYYDGAFELMQISPYWSRGYLTDWYAAPVSGLNFNDNCVDVTVFPTTPGQPVKFEVTPSVTDIKFGNNCTTAEPGETDNADIDRAADTNVFTITGHATKKTTLQSKAVIDPGAFFADALRTELRSQGIEVTGHILRAAKPLDDKEIPAASKVVAVHESNLKDILWRILQNSQNLFAECADKLSGKAYANLKGDTGPGTWEKGSAATHAFLRSYSVNDKPLVAVDGSGLARADRVSPRMITDLLAAMYRHPYSSIFRASMAHPGANGTLGKRLTDLDGNVFAKTGYIGGVRSLSGYIHTKNNRWLAFSFLYNKIPGSVKPYEESQDEAVRFLYNNF